MKRMYLSKTIAANVLVIALAYWFRFSSFYVDPMWFVWTIAAVNIGLRLVTRQPVAWR
ncbi:MAG: hypothetical protein ABI665_03760 [Vicinamibacterales bacterium]